MCTSTATLVYGITLQALELCIAAGGYKRVKPALLAVDLVRSRKANGTLETSTPERRTTVCAVPVEVWDLVKGELVDLAFDRERRRVARVHHDPRGDCCHAAHTPGGRGADLFSCDWGYEELAEVGVQALVEPYYKKVTTLLNDFGLCLVSPTLVSLDELAWTDLDSVWTIALPLATDDEGRFPSARTALRHVYGPTHALSAISPSTFVLPADADTRFRRLLSTFPILEPVSLTADTIRPRAEQDTAREFDAGSEHEDEQEQISEAQRREEAARARRIASEPRWILWTEGDSCI